MKSKYATEAEMCSAFIAALPDEWTAYAETAGWDILLVRKDGVQIGIQAKLKMNADVLIQAIESRWGHSNVPDFRAVLVPYGETGKLREIAGMIGITVLTVKPPAAGWGRTEVYPYLPRIGSDGDDRDGWFDQCPLKRHELPDYVPDVAAGAPSPLQLTHWKIKAIKIAVTLEARGFVTRADFRAHHIDHRRWTTQGWLEAKDGRYVRGPEIPDFKLQHPVVYEQIKSDSDKWMPQPPPPPLIQRALAF